MSFLQNNAQYAKGVSWPGDREARQRWQVERDAADRIPPHPAPEIPSRPASDSEIPRTALSLRVAAEKAGWTVSATYARGTLMDARGRAADKVVDSIALRMSHPDGRRAVAIWNDGKAGIALIRDPGMFPRKVTVTEAKKLILEPVRSRGLVLAS